LELKNEPKKFSISLGVTSTAFLHLRETETQAGTTITKVQNPSFSPLEFARVSCRNPYYFVVNSKHG
jgi:hypothetical protein